MLSQRQQFLQHQAQTSDMPLAIEVESASGIYITDIYGEKYIDLIAGIGVSSIGHCHKNVVNAVQTQATKYMHTMVYGEYIQTPQLQLAVFLASLLPSNLDTVYFTNSGTEATEGAMKLAKRYTGKTEFISCINSYHGSTQGALSLMGDEYFKSNYRPLLPNTKQIRYNNIEDVNLITTKTAAVFIEVVQAESGITIGTNEFLTAIRNKCNETKTLLVFDEIQTGCGRTGKLFAFEHYQIIPDILLLAKGLGGGMPIGCFIASNQIMQVFQNNPVLGHITTFGGNAVCCAAALATLQTIINEKLIEKIAEKEQLFVSKLKHSSIQKITHKGLMIAVHLDSFDHLQKTIQHCLQNGLITDWFLFANNCLRIAPPLTITNEEIEKSCGIIIDALNKIYN